MSFCPKTALCRTIIICSVADNDVLSLGLTSYGGTGLKCRKCLLLLCGCATTGRGLKPLFPARAAIVFTSDSSYEINLSQNILHIHVYLLERERIEIRPHVFLTCIPSFLLKEKTQENIKCCVSCSWLQLPVLICPSVTKQLIATF